MDDKKDDTLFKIECAICQQDISKALLAKANLGKGKGINFAINKSGLEKSASMISVISQEPGINHQRRESKNVPKSASEIMKKGFKSTVDTADESKINGAQKKFQSAKETTNLNRYAASRNTEIENQDAINQLGLNPQDSGFNSNFDFNFKNVQ